MGVTPGPRVYPDACVLIYFVENHPGWATEIGRRIDPVQGPRPTLVFTELTRLECRVRPLKNGSASILDAYELVFGTHGYAWTPIDRACFETATALRAAHGLKTADALHLAAALQAGCDEFWTNDQRLAQAAQGRLRIVNLHSTSAG